MSPITATAPRRIIEIGWRSAPDRLDDAGDALIGTWRGVSVENELSYATTVTLRADQTGHFESVSTPSLSRISAEASWQQQGDDVAVRATVSSDVIVMHYATRVDGVLGTSFQRLEP